MCASAVLLVEFKGVWNFLYINTQFIFNKWSETKLNNIFGFCFFLRQQFASPGTFFESVTVTID